MWDTGERADRLVIDQLRPTSHVGMLAMLDAISLHIYIPPPLPPYVHTSLPTSLPTYLPPSSLPTYLLSFSLPFLYAYLASHHTSPPFLPSLSRLTPYLPSLRSMQISPHTIPPLPSLYAYLTSHHTSHCPLPPLLYRCTLTSVPRIGHAGPGG